MHDEMGDYIAALVYLVVPFGHLALSYSRPLYSSLNIHPNP